MAVATAVTLPINLRHQLADAPTLGIVHLQQRYGCAARRSQPQHVGVLIEEMIEPRIAAGIEQDYDFPASRINRGQVRTLLEIAVRTGQREVMGIICSTVLSRDDVLYVKTQFGKFLRHAAVFTTLASSRADELTQLRVHWLRRR